MQDYSFFILDDRYSVPTLRMCPFADAEPALRHADAILNENTHHLAVEIELGGASVEGSPRKRGAD